MTDTNSQMLRVLPYLGNICLPCRIRIYKIDIWEVKIQRPQPKKQTTTTRVTWPVLKGVCTLHTHTSFLREMTRPNSCLVWNPGRQIDSARLIHTIIIIYFTIVGHQQMQCNPMQQQTYDRKAESIQRFVSSTICILNRTHTHIHPTVVLLNNNTKNKKRKGRISTPNSRIPSESLMMKPFVPGFYTI